MFYNNVSGNQKDLSNLSLSVIVWALHKYRHKKSDQIKVPHIEKNIIWIHLQSKYKNLIHSSWFSIQTSILIS